MTSLDLFIWGFAGAALEELLHWSALRKVSELPTYLRQAKYYVITALLMATGGVTALAIGTSGSMIGTPLAALLAGFTSPTLLKKLAKAFITTATAGSTAQRASVRRFLTN